MVKIEAIYKCNYSIHSKKTLWTVTQRGPMDYSTGDDTIIVVFIICKVKAVYKGLLQMTRD